MFFYIRGCENIGYVDEDGVMDGLYVSLEDGIVDSTGKMGYSYPGDVTKYAQSVPVGAFCEAQACIGVDNPGSFNIIYNKNSPTSAGSEMNCISEHKCSKEFYK